MAKNTPSAVAGEGSFWAQLAHGVTVAMVARSRDRGTHVHSGDVGPTQAVDETGKRQQLRRALLRVARWRQATSCRRMTDLAPPNGMSARAFFKVMTRESRQASSVATSKEGYANQRTPPRPGPSVVSSTEIAAVSPLARSWQRRRFSPRTERVPGTSTGSERGRARRTNGSASVFPFGAPFSPGCWCRLNRTAQNCARMKFNRTEIFIGEISETLE